MFRKTAAVLFPLLSAVASGAQEPGQSNQAQIDWRMPFRAPQQNVLPLEPIYEHLRPMYRIAQSAPREQKRFDETGAEVVDDPAWQKHHTALLEMQQDPGYLSVIIRDSRNVTDRRLAFYGAFYVPVVEHVFNLIGHIPGEPLREVREEAFLRAVEYLAAQFGKKNEGSLEDWRKLEVGPAGTKPPRPGDWSYALDPAPFAALMRVGEDADRRQVLWFFARCVDIRREYAREVLPAIRGQLATLLGGEPSPVRAAAHDLLTRLDPDPARTRPAADGPSASLVAWLSAIEYELFPPIRRISSGLIELYASDDLDSIVRVGEGALRTGSAGTTSSGKTSGGSPFRGLLLAEVPAPLDKLGLFPGMVITAVNGAPVADCAALLSLLQRAAPNTRSYLVEYVAPDKQLCAIEYRRR